VIDLRAAAHEWAAGGWSVLPCQPGGKRPLPSTGFKAATTDAFAIEAWWRDCPRANVGVRLPEDMLVVDIDRHGGEDGFASLAALEDLPETFTIATGGGGEHRWLSVPVGVRVSRRVGVVPGIDLLAGGTGFALVPPSVRFGGRPYRLAVDAPIAPAPRWLLRLAAPPPPRAPDPRAVAGATVGRIAGLRHTVASAPEGRRNELSFWAACVAADLGLDPEEVILPAALASGLDVNEVRALCASARRRVAGVGR